MSRVYKVKYFKQGYFEVMLLLSLKELLKYFLYR